MAQIIRHRRGSLEALPAVTSSLQKGEIVIASGSSNLTTTNGTSLVFASQEAGQVQAVNRFLMGNSNPATFAGSTYGGMVNGVPYYASGSATLFLLGSDTNAAINLVGNIQPFSTSVNSRLAAVEASVGGGGDIGMSVTFLNQFTASATIRLNNLETTSASVNSRLEQLSTDTGSQNTRITVLENKATTLQTYTASVDSRLNQLSTATGSQNSRLTNLETTSASLLIETSNLELFSASAISRLDQLSTDTGSQNTRITTLENKATTLQTYTASNDTTNTTQNSRLDQLSTFTASNGNTSLNSYTASNDTKWSTLGSLSGSFARTNSSNTFNGNQIVSGSVTITQDLIVLGSSSIQNISSSRLDIGDNIIQLNVNQPSVRFGGIAVFDSGSAAGSGSFLYDAVEDEFIFVHRGNGTNVTSSHFVLGPETYDNLGNEIYLTNNRLPKGTGKEHLNDSNITDNGTVVSINSNTQITGSLTVSNGIIGAINATNGVVSGSAQVTRLLPTGVVSGSSQVDFTGISFVPINLVSGSGTTSTITMTIDGGVITANAIGGIVSGSSQVVGILSSLNSYTASNDTTNATQNSRLDQLSTDSGSQNTRITVLESKATTLATVTSSLLIETSNLETFSASALLKLGSLETFTASNGNTSLNSFTASNANTSLNSYTASNDTTNTTQNSRLSQLETDSGSQNTRITVLESKATTLQTYTASVDSRLNQLSTNSGSHNIRLNNLETFTSSTYSTFSTSVDSRIDTLEGAGTIQGLGTGNQVTFSRLTTTGDAIIMGDLVVQGNTVSLNTGILQIEDKLITIASGSTSPQISDGAGIEVAGANATFTYASTPNAWTANIPISASAFTGSLNVPGGSSSKRIAFRNTNDNINFVTAPTTDGDLLQWNGTDFVMSNVIDGGSF